MTSLIIQTFLSQPKLTFMVNRSYMTATTSAATGSGLPSKPIARELHCGLGITLSPDSILLQHIFFATTQ
jgi:hypothetical protein